MQDINIVERIKRVRREISAAAVRAGRKPGEVRFIAVTKGIQPARIREAYDAGLREFGENYIQEAIGKIDLLPSDVKWHFIGRLQTNKAKYIPGRFIAVHSVERDDIAQQLQMVCEKKGIKMDIMIQVNVSGEKSKSGVTTENTLNLFNNVLKYNNIVVSGLMTIPPYSDDAESSRVYFRALRNLRDDLIHAGVPEKCLGELSMGMSGDFEIAVEEGATVVRIGTAIFGSRG
ncbi:MAG TPA: YggS family pyridoxal phosphate-dependent enzyme [bacterium]